MKKEKTMDKNKKKPAIEEKWFIWIMVGIFAIINIAGIIILGLSYNWAWHFSYIALIVIDLLICFGVCYYFLGFPDKKETKVEVKQEGADTLKFLKRIKDCRIEGILRKYGEAGVSALMAATPVDTGRTASMWGYEIEKTSSGWTINWTNSNINNHVNIAVI